MIKTSCLCYLPQPSASGDNTDLGFDNTQYHAQPHPIIVYYTLNSKHGNLNFHVNVWNLILLFFLVKQKVYDTIPLGQCAFSSLLKLIIISRINEEYSNYITSHGTAQF